MPGVGASVVHTVTIFVDPQAGSCDLIPYFKRYVIPRSLLVSNVMLPSGDVSFTSKEDEHGRFLRIGIEVKKLDDVLKCFIDNRFTDVQLEKMAGTDGPGSGDYDEIWLLIIDDFKAEEGSGYLVKKRRVSYTGRGRYRARRGRGDGAWVPASYSDAHQQKYSTFIKWLGTIERFMQSAGYSFNIWNVHDEDEAARWCLAQYEWHNDKRFDQHKAMKGFSTADDDKRTKRKSDGSTRRMPIFLPHDVKLRAKVIGQFDGVGYETAVAIARRFGNVQEMLTAGEGILSRIKVGKSVLGVKRATKLYNQIRGIK